MAASLPGPNCCRMVACYWVFSGSLKWMGFLAVSGDCFRTYFLSTLRVWHTKLSAGRCVNRATLIICLRLLSHAGSCIPLLVTARSPWTVTSFYQNICVPGQFMSELLLLNEYIWFLFVSLKASENPFCCEEIMQMLKPYLFHSEECFTWTQNAMWANCN